MEKILEIKRDFILEEISFDEFNETSRQFGLNTYQAPDYYERSSDMIKKRGFFKGLEGQSFPVGIERIMDDLKKDPQLVPVCFWYYRHLSSEAATRYTLTENKKYKRDLIRIEDRFSKLTIRVVSLDNLQEYEHTRRHFLFDAFSFNKENGLWVLRRGHANNLNFRYSTFLDRAKKEVEQTDRYALCTVFNGGIPTQ